ncbi:hypothetical protein L1887_18868 [Cichorium endivia]|nr:hypothetical protein L1887_18868 [Cichorium endivia]
METRIVIHGRKHNIRLARNVGEAIFNRSTETHADDLLDQHPPPPKLCGPPGGPPVTGPRVTLRDGHTNNQNFDVTLLTFSFGRGSSGGGGVGRIPDMAFEDWVKSFVVFFFLIGSSRKPMKSMIRISLINFRSILAAPAVKANAEPVKPSAKVSSKPLTPAQSASSYNSPCAACKFLRRKSMTGCIFAPYFPPKEPQKLANVHKIFGASNVTKLLNDLLPHQREDAVNSLAYEAEACVRDPV